MRKRKSCDGLESVRAGQDVSVQWKLSDGSTEWYDGRIMYVYETIRGPCDGKLVDARLQVLFFDGDLTWLSHLLSPSADRLIRWRVPFGSGETRKKGRIELIKGHAQS